MSTELLHSYVSPILLSRLAEGRPIDAPEIRTAEAAVVAIDVKGFSPMVEDMSRQGPVGIEKLASHINSCFGSLVDSIHDYRGIAHIFPGDAVIALWPEGASSLAESTHLAAACAKDLISGGVRAPGVLPLKAGLAAGTITTSHVGGVNDRWQLFVTGEALTQMGEAQQRARHGELVLSQPAWRLLCADATAAEERGEFVVLESVLPAPKSPSAAQSIIPTSYRSLLRCYLPDGLSARLGSIRGDWVGEFRRLSILFVRMNAYLRGQELDADLIHRSFQKIQQVIYHYDAGVVQICHDDKGVVVLAAMGLPGMVHEDDTQRAALVALCIQDELERIEVKSSIGVATGRTFCGLLGNQSRCEYSLVGLAVNRAARLMEEVRGGVLCDAASAEVAGSRLSFEGPLPLRLKGFEEDVPAFRPRLQQPALNSSEYEASNRGRAISATRIPMVGREPERAALYTWLKSVNGGWGGVLAIRGEAGIGKSLLARELIQHAQGAGMTVLLGFCDLLKAGVAYYPWRSVIEKVLELRGLKEPAEQRAQVMEHVATTMGDAALAPLLESVLPIELPESRVSRQMDGLVRRDNTIVLLSSLIREAARRHRERGSTLLIVLEDLQWMDSASWSLLDMLRRSGDDLPLGIAVTLRELPRFEQSESVNLLSADDTEVLDLELLTENATRELVKLRLSTEEIAEDLAALIYRRTQGNPFFCEELLTVMQKMAVIRAEGDRTRLIGRGDQLVESVVPNSVAGVLETRIDQLSEPLQLAIKAASVIGHTIEPDLLQAIHPLKLNHHAVERQLKELTELDLLRSKSGKIYFFKHAITHNVTYERLLPSQQKKLHRAVAEHLEERADVAPWTLYGHWRKSGDIEQALKFVDASGDEAMHQGSYHEAVELFTWALNNCSDLDKDTKSRLHPGAEVTRAVSWRIQLGKAQVALGHHKPGLINLELGLQDLGHPVPNGRTGLSFGILRELCRQVSHRLLPGRLIRIPPTREPQILISAEAYEQLGYIYYAACKTLHGVYAALKMLNLSERSRITPVLARSYAAMCLTAAVIPQRKLAAFFERAAKSTAEELEDPLTEAYVRWISSLRAAGEGRWTDVKWCAGRATILAKRFGDLRLRVMSLETLASAAAMQGHFDRAVDRSQDMLDVANKGGNRLWEAWALNSFSEATHVRGDDEATVKRCKRVLNILAEESDKTEVIRAIGIQAAALLRLDTHREALEAASETASHIATRELTSFATFEGFAGVCEVMLTLAKGKYARGSVLKTTLGKDAKQACRAMRKYARIFPVGRPRWIVTKARMLALRGRRAAAVNALERAVVDAENLCMPYEQGLALLELGHCTWLPEKKRKDAFVRALDLLPQGFAHRRAKQLLKGLKR